MLRKSFAGVVLAALAAFISLPANAASVTHCGPTVCYTYDNAQAAVALFGQPQFQGDIVRFLPQDFRAESLDGAGFDTATANFIFDDIYTVGGEDIEFIMVVEQGDYEIINGDSATVDLYLQASSNVDFFDFTSTTSSLDFNGDSGGIQRWRLDATLNPAADFFSPANSMAVNIQNTLQAFTDENGESAWIQKKIVLGVNTVVPLPASVWLFGSALAGLGWLRRKMAA